MADRELAAHGAARMLCAHKHGDARYDPGRKDHRKWLERGRAAVAGAEPHIRADERRKVIAELRSERVVRAACVEDARRYAESARQAQFSDEEAVEVYAESNRRLLDAVAASLLAPEGEGGEHAHDWRPSGTWDTGSDPQRQRWDCSCGEEAWTADLDGPDAVSPSPETARAETRHDVEVWTELLADGVHWSIRVGGVDHGGGVAVSHAKALFDASAHMRDFHPAAFAPAHEAGSTHG
jgi:hypothetical protein